MSKITVRKIHETKVNYKKLMQDLREQYPFDPLSILIIETFVNSMDARATQIEICVGIANFTVGTQ